MSYDTEAGYDNVIVEAHPVGTDEWTTLPEAGGLSDTTPPTECEVGFLLELHPFLEHYLTGGDTCTPPTGSTGEWNAITGTSEAGSRWPSTCPATRAGRWRWRSAT